MPGITERSTKPPLLHSRFMSHGTLECRDLQKSRRFYEEVLGLEVVQQALTGIFIRLGGQHCYAVIETPGTGEEMPLFNHNGIDLDSDDEVRAAYEAISKVKDEYGIRRITKPVDQHGTFSFYLQDLDGNWWEICHLPKGGYAFRFDREEADLTGRHDLEPDEIHTISRRPFEYLARIDGTDADGGH